MSDQSKKKMVREIKVDLDKCVGCRACEVACSGFHASPKYSSFNPARSRIRLVLDPVKDVYVPLRAGEYTAAECTGRQTFKIDGKQYSECSFCPASCPSRDLFKEPDSGLPLKCDMCEDEEMPMCVQVCRPGALTYEEREEERADEEPVAGELEISLKSLVHKHGYQKLMDTFARLSQND
jgi:benzoyl-CoA reductase subunit BamC